MRVLLTTLLLVLFLTGCSSERTVMKNADSESSEKTTVSSTTSTTSSKTTNSYTCKTFSTCEESTQQITTVSQSKSLSQNLQSEKANGKREAEEKVAQFCDSD